MSNTLGISYPFDSGAVTQYQGWPFGDFFEIGGVAYGLAADGIYRLGGDEDAGEPIAWAFEGPKTNADTDSSKRLRSVSIEGSVVAGLCVSTRFDGHDWREALDVGGGLFAVSRDVVGQAMQFRVEGAGAVAITGISVSIFDLGRWRRG